METVILILALIFGLYMAWSIGANDVANAMGTSVGSGALTLKRAVILAAVLEFAGAFFVGSHVSETVRKGIIDVTIFEGEPMLLVYGMMAALLSAAVWLQFATFFGLPVSTTHSIVGAIVGFGAVVGGFSAVHWEKVGTITLSWITSPLLAGLVAFLLFTILRKYIFLSRYPVRRAKHITPVLVFFVFSILTLVLVFKGLKNLHLNLPLGQAILLAIGIGLLTSLISFLLVRRIKEEYTKEELKELPSTQFSIGMYKAEKNLKKALLSAQPEFREKLSELLEEVKTVTSQLKEIEKNNHKNKEVSSFRKVERIFVYLQILSASFVAFAHGANDVANSIGPLSAVIEILKSGVVTMKTVVPLWVLGLGGFGIVLGLATWGWRVIETVGKKITELSPTRGFSAEFAAAITIVLASKLGIPISTTHTLVGAVIGVGLARGIGALNLRTVRDIVISWVVTIPAGAGLAILFFYTLQAIFG